MKAKVLFMFILLILGGIQLKAQLDPLGILPRNCISIDSVEQVCNEDGTVTINFQITNNSECSSSGVTISPIGGLGQSHPFGIGPNPLSTGTISYIAAVPGSSVCFEIILHGSSGRDCCRTKICIDVDCCELPGCCDLKAELAFVYHCDPAGLALINVTGGTPPYSGPGIPIGPGTPGIPNGVVANFGVPDLAPGPHTLVYTDINGCTAEVTFTIGESDLEASASVLCDEAVITITGGTPPYSIYSRGNTISGNSVTLNGLPPGDYNIAIFDDVGCHVNVPFIIQEMQVSIITQDSDCVFEGTVEITISGGTPPYFHPNGQELVDGYYVNRSISPGDYEWIFYDSNGCEVVAIFSIGYTSGGCSQFAFEKDEDDADSSTGDYQQTMTSFVSATIYVSLSAQTVPDQLIVKVNDEVVVNFSAGSSSCDDNDYPPGQGPTNSVEIDSFCVTYCDEVEFIVLGDVCPGNSYTVWNLSVSCQAKDGSGITLTDPNNSITNRSKSGRRLEGPFEEMSLNSQEKLHLFPNPVSDVLNISVTDTGVDYQTVRIINSNGKEVFSKDISGSSQLQIDASALPTGIYIIELKNNDGINVVEKFIKQ